MKYFTFILLFLFAFSSCEKEDSPEDTDSKLAHYLSDYPDWETSMDDFSMDSVRIDGDSLRLHVGYSGGCAIHEFRLWILETGIDGEGEPHLMLEHIANGDMCEAFLWEWLSFSIEPLQELDKNKVVFWLRGSPMMSMLFGSYTYEF